MPNFQVISLDRHASLRWKRYSSYAHASQEAVIPLAGAEMPKAAMTLPIGFIKQDDNFFPIAVLGLQPGQNLFVAADGRWTGNYIPAAFRSHPFRLAQTKDAQQALCIDEDSGLVTSGPEGESFFTDDGKPSQGILDILDFLGQIEQSRLSTVAACAVLQKHSLIRPWPVTLKTESGEQQVAGLLQIDEAALMALPADALVETRNAGALSLAYCQLISMQHLPMLGQLAISHAQAKANQLASANELKLDFLNQGETLSFGNLG